MNKFCTKCGKPLVEGQVCDCQKSNVNITNNNSTNSVGYSNIVRENVDNNVNNNVSSMNVSNNFNNNISNMNISSNLSENVSSMNTNNNFNNNVSSMNTNNNFNNNVSSMNINNNFNNNVSSMNMNNNFSNNVSNMNNNFSNNVSNMNNNFSNMNYANQQNQKNSGEVMNLFKRFWKKPIDGASSFVLGENVGSAIVMMLIQSVVSGLFAMFCALNWINNGFTQYSVGMGQHFILAFLFSAIFTATFIGTICLSMKVYGMSVPTKSIVCIVAMRSVPIIMIDIVASLVAIASPMVGFLMFVLSGIIGLLYLFATFNNVMAIEGNEKTMVMIIATIIFMIVFVIVVRLAINWECFLPTSCSSALERIVKVVS